MKACHHANCGRDQSKRWSREDYLALHIAVAAEQAGYSTVLIDMDPQGTAEAWSESRKEAPPVVIPAKTATLVRTLEKASGLGADFAVIDTPPLAEAEARTAAKAADLVLVPCRPNAFDLHSIRTTTDLTHFAAKPAFAVFNAGPVSASRLYAETTELVTEIGMKVAPVRLSSEPPSVAATGLEKRLEVEPEGRRQRGRWRGYGAGYVNRWLCQHDNMITRSQR